MACSRFEYVKVFEEEHRLLPQCWGVIRLDGRAFTKFSKAHGFKKPNDDRCIGLMNYCAVEVMRQYPDVIMAYGHSDEYSFVLKRDSTLWNRREQKIVTTMVSLFTSTFVFAWPLFFTNTDRLQYPPSFDGRMVCYPNDHVLRDYVSWRQADCHVNNQYNTCFWALVQQENKGNAEAYSILQGTQTAEKNELLFSRFGINYNSLSPVHRKGTTLVRWPPRMRQNGIPEKTSSGDAALSSTGPLPATKDDIKTATTKNATVSETENDTSAASVTANDGRAPFMRTSFDHSVTKYWIPGTRIEVLHEDIIRQPFWDSHPHILATRAAV